MTVDKLGVKLYDRVYAVIAELISNSYDADATVVTVTAPMGQYLAIKKDGKIAFKEVTIEVCDNGIGMEPDELQNFYLVVGAERRNDPKRGDRTKKFQRAVMGRKGVGKLAPFGVCRIVEIISSGGSLITEGDAHGYRTAHIILDKDGIMSDTPKNYYPDIGSEDGKLADKTGTKIILRDFYYKRMSDIKELSRQLAQRFGILSSNWSIQLIDASKTSSDPEYSTTVGKFAIDIMKNSKITFDGNQPTHIAQNNSSYIAKGPDGTGIPNDKFEAGFWYNLQFYPIVGWMAYAKESYKDELMAGVRIYCRGKIAAQTLVFNRKAGFTGEHSIRSYLVGEIYADWLDESEDLIQTDRRDILWSHEIGELFQDWGQKAVVYIGLITRDPMRKQMQQQFFEIGKVRERIQEAFPTESQKVLRETATDIATLMGKSLRGDELSDEKAVGDLVDLCILLAPIQDLDKRLQEAADADLTTLPIINGILKSARIAELVTFGRQIQKRIEIIDNLELLKDTDETDESELQKLIEEAPWLINPQWRPITANQRLSTLKREFEKYYHEATGLDVNLSDFTQPTKRPDFVAFSQDGALQLIEIKRPKHTIDNTEWDRVQTYFDQLEAFFANQKHKDFKSIANCFYITLVCDGVDLTGSQKKAFESYNGLNLTVLDWSAFLLRTKTTHQEFLEEAERLKGVS
ncbi:MAG: hypothetical protein ZNDK_0843 [Candidatus Desulfovibrio kirbyi]|uniref:ATP-binding protein n=1 Tax=Candidatus Desulfovibrio kirbyi TaxID=2696086 RepID=A0A6L2R6J6_9BACT|nr:MAG: hypothetical protein ZNDK_0843 [Candidatus Desulfovibrio kirbyi]